MNSFLEPFKKSIIIKIILAIVMFFYTFVMNAQVDKNSDLHKTLKSKDSIIFERTFNKCEIEKLEPIIAEDFEFYHDIAGIQNRKEFINAVKNNICSKPGNNKRNLVKGSLEVFEMKNNNKIYGAIQKGKHTFQQKIDGKMKTLGIADFTHLWILENNIWKLKRVLSYNHQPYTE
ncbi:nuclear transport factor 2 family protein [Polaribacter sp. MSW13]|uniref:Nuclear transport factor 2 family protein n=1 Tax=Polaribacter marinus TaxID=2916838 RepID=A0A9X2AKH9_9FLAO|nr:nuclear transport factor 2 family protein [Polaribacter marinus]MCI2229543.1 nuclear transport factor 2 family protein [Polaribacter marinus]